VTLFFSKIEGLLTHESRPGRISAGRRGQIFDLDCSDWSNGLRYHNFDTRPDTEFNLNRLTISSKPCTLRSAAFILRLQSLTAMAAARACAFSCAG